MSLIISSFAFLLALTVLTTLHSLNVFARIVGDVKHQLLVQDLLIPLMVLAIYVLWGAWFNKLQGLPVWG